MTDGTRAAADIGSGSTPAWPGVEMVEDTNATTSAPSGPSVVVRELNMYSV